MNVNIDEKTLLTSAEGRAAAFTAAFDVELKGQLAAANNKQDRAEELVKLCRLEDFSPDQEKAAMAILEKQENTKMYHERRTWSVDDFDSLGVLGRGAFGIVHEVRRKLDGSRLALKQVSLDSVKRRTHLERVYTERAVQAAASSPFIVQLHHCFVTGPNFYLVLELCHSDLISHLIEHQRLGEGPQQSSVVKFYMAQLLLAIEHVHRMGFVHRDLKPENVAFSFSGHIKLLDFGLAKLVKTTLKSGADDDDDVLAQARLSDLKGVEFLFLEQYDGADVAAATDVADVAAATDVAAAGSANVSAGTSAGTSAGSGAGRKALHSFCGTPQYMAPEVVRGEPYDHRCDLWSFACIVWDCMVGGSPFAPAPRLRPKEAVNCVMQRVAHFQSVVDRLWKLRETKKYMSYNCGHMERSLLAEQQLRPTVAELKACPWFAPVDFANLHKARPPLALPPPKKSKPAVPFRPSGEEDGPSGRPEMTTFDFSRIAQDLRVDIGGIVDQVKIESSVKMNQSS